MKALLVDLDSKGNFANLAIMKLSRFLKETCKLEVELVKGDPGLELYGEYDYCYVSCIFQQNKQIVENIRDRSNFFTIIGGGGIDKDAKLPDHIEHLMPDYDLYDMDYSMGFTSRGCVNNCPFCEVPEREGGFREHADPEEFLHPDHDKVVLLDNNFLASKKWKSKLVSMYEDGYKVNINQGLDARLIDKAGAKILKEYPSYSRSFNEKGYYTAWDLMGNEKPVLKGINNLIEAGINPRYIRPYILVNFNTTLKEDLYRFNKLREMGTYPFIIPYNKSDHPMERYGQRPALYKTCTFEEYCEEKGIEVDIE